MKFNKSLLIEGYDKDLQKLVLFCLQEGINLWDYTEDADGRLMLKDNHVRNINAYRRDLARQGKVKTRYTEGIQTENILSEPIYVQRQLVQVDIQKYRGLFSAKSIGIAGRMGDKDRCEELMLEFLKTYKDYDFNEILKVTELFIESQKQEPEFIPRADNFIKNDKGESRLFQYLENPPQGS